MDKDRTDNDLRFLLQGETIAEIVYAENDDVIFITTTSGKKVALHTEGDAIDAREGHWITL